jgi:hypothetical protein
LDEQLLRLVERRYSFVQSAQKFCRNHRATEQHGEHEQTGPATPLALKLFQFHRRLPRLDHSVHIDESLRDSRRGEQGGQLNDDPLFIFSNTHRQGSRVLLFLGRAF